MPFPLVPVLAGLMVSGLGISMGSNLYKQHLQRQLWSKQANAYMNLHNGYNRHLEKYGRSINPDRAWSSYYGQAMAARNNIQSSYASSVGTVGGTFGAMAGFGKGLYNTGKTSRRL